MKEKISSRSKALSIILSIRCVLVLSLCAMQHGKSTYLTSEQMKILSWCGWIDHLHISIVTIDPIFFAIRELNIDRRFESFLNRARNESPVRIARYGNCYDRVPHHPYRAAVTEQSLIGSEISLKERNLD